MPSERIKSDTPPSRFTTLTIVLCPENIGFHWVWTVAYPLPMDRRGNELKGLLAHHGYPSLLRSSKIYDFVLKTIREKGYAPSISEIGAKFKITSTNGASDHLKALDEPQLIFRAADRKPEP